MATRSTKETYTHGYSRAATTAMGLRNAEIEAGFFLPHIRKGMKLLDCGCGPGTITSGLAKAVAPGRAVGIDLSEAQLEVTRARALANKIKNLELRAANVYEIPFPDATFDAVFSHTLLEHLKQPERAIKEMIRVLKPGGVLGARSGISGSAVFSPHSKAASRWAACLERMVKKNGGSLDFGVVQSALIRRAGLERVISTTSTDYRSGGGWYQKVFAPPLKDHHGVLRAQGVPEKEIGSVLAGISRWARNPDAFSSVIVAETVGWKPS